MTTKHAPATKLPDSQFTFQVVNGMVAVEHVRYLWEDRAKLIEALRDLIEATTHPDPGGMDAAAIRTAIKRRARALLQELGEE